MSNLENIATWIDVGSGYRVALPYEDTLHRIECAVAAGDVWLTLPLLMGTDDNVDNEVDGWAVRAGSVKVSRIEAVHPQSAKSEDAESIVVAIGDARTSLPHLFVEAGI